MRCRRLGPDECPELWSTARPEPNAEFEHFHLVCRLRPEILEPYVLLVDAGASDRGDLLLVGRLERQVLQGRLGYLRIGRLPVTAWVGVHGGMLGQPDEFQVEAALIHVTGLLASGRADMAVFHGVPRDSPLWAALGAIRQRKNFPFTYASPWSPHFQLRLENDPEFLWKRMRSKHRSWLRGRERRLVESQGAQVRWLWHNEFGALDELLPRLETVAARTYQRALGAGFRDDNEHRQRFRLFARQGILRIQTLEAEHAVLAYWIGLLSEKAFFSSETGYDPQLAEYELGKLVFFKMVENLVREGAELLDFGLGDADYKRRFADHHYLERDIYLCRRSPRGLAAFALVAGLGRTHSALKLGVQSLGRLNAVRTRWRRRLRRKRSGT